MIIYKQNPVHPQILKILIQTIINYQLSIINYQSHPVHPQTLKILIQTIINYQLSIIHYQLSITSRTSSNPGDPDSDNYQLSI
ncbi:MAG: hypothetical protein ACKPBB_09080, partial [Sphaerospermopsis kisseleviana]